MLANDLALLNGANLCGAEKKPSQQLLEAEQPQNGQQMNIPSDIAEDEDEEGEERVGGRDGGNLARREQKQREMNKQPMRKKKEKVGGGGNSLIVSPVPEYSTIGPI